MDLAASLDSGQVFHWHAIGANRFAGAIGNTLTVVRQNTAGELSLECGDPMQANWYFALDHNLEAVYSRWPNGPLNPEALLFCRGIRILRQPLWECTATFITSAQKQVAHIRQISLALREKHGALLGNIAGNPIHAYPDPACVASLPECELRALKLGYRAPLVRAAAEAFASGTISQETILHGPPQAALQECLKIPGVGVKVANCILLFAAGRLESVPVDVWIGRVAAMYTKRKLKDPVAYLRKKFGPDAGYVQQYLFHYLRKTVGRGTPRLFT